MAFGPMLSKVKPYVVMMFLQVGFAGMYIISLASIKHGMSHYVLVVYRNVVAAVVSAPFALWFERKVRPKMTPTIFVKIMLLAFLEPVLDQNFYYVGANYTSTGYGAALYNLLPAITFLMATLLRMESVKIKKRRSQAKVLGTLVMVAGALLMILYKGPLVEFIWSKKHGQYSIGSTEDDGKWLRGTFMLLAGCTCWSCFFILQSHTLASYSAELSLTSLVCLMGAAESTVVALVMEHKNGAKTWAIGWDSRLLTAIYSGVVCSGIAYYVQGVVIKERGPVFVTAFNPLCMIITALMGSIILAEVITLGRVIGAAIIVIGLYLLLWVKSKDNSTASIITETRSVLELPRSAKDSSLSLDHKKSRENLVNN